MNNEVAEAAYVKSCDELAEKFCSEIARIKPDDIEEARKEAEDGYNSRAQTLIPTVFDVYFAFLHEDDSRNTLEVIWWNAKDPHVRLMVLCLMVLPCSTDIAEGQLMDFIEKSSRMSEMEKLQRWKEIDTFRKSYSLYAEAIMKIAPPWMNPRKRELIQHKVNDKKHRYPLSRDALNRK